MKKKELVIVSVTFAFFLLTLIRNLDLSKMWVFADLLPFPDNVSHRLEEVIYLWSNEGLGGIISPMTNIIRFTFFVQLLFNSIIAQKIIIFLPFVVGFISMYSLLRYFELSSISSYLAALIYAINPVTISFFLIGDAGPSMVSAIFPLFIIFLDKYLFFNKKIIHNYLAIIGIISFLFFWNFYYTLWFGTFSFIFLILKNVKSMNGFTTGIFKKLLGIVIILILINLPNAFVFSLLNRDLSTSKSLDINTQASYSYGDATILNLLRLAGNKGTPQIKGYLDYDSLNSFTVFGYVLSFLSLGSLLIRKQNIKKIAHILYPAGVLFLIIIGLTTIIKIMPNVIGKSTILFTLRSPDKLMMPLTFFFAILFSISYEYFIWNSELHKKHNTLVKFILSAIILISFFVYMSPVLIDGTFGVSKMSGSVFIPHNYEIDEKYSQLKQNLEQENSNFSKFTVLYLPWERFSKGTISRTIPNYFGISGSAAFSSNMKQIRYLYENLEKNPSNKAELLAVFNIKYIIIEKNFETINLEDSKTMEIRAKCDNLNMCWFTGNSKIFYDLFKTDDNFTLIYSDEYFYVFENKLLKVPRDIYVYPLGALNKTPTTNTYSKNIFNSSLENKLDGFKVVGQYEFNNDSVDGNQSIVLYSKGIEWPHIYKIIPIKEKNDRYNISFSIKGHNITDLHAKILWYDRNPKIYDGDENIIRSDYIKIYETKINNSEWFYVEKSFIPPENATYATLVILGSRSETTLKNFSSSSTLIDNVLFSLDTTEFNINSSVPDKNETVNYEKINPTLWNVKINTSEPFILALDTIYDPLWYARIDKINGTPVDSKTLGLGETNKVRPVPLYSVINGFWINETGDLDITIEYEPQKWFYIGTIISLTTLIACILYLIYDWRKSRRPGDSRREHGKTLKSILSTQEKTLKWRSDWKPVKGDHAPIANLSNHKFEDSFESISEAIRNLQQKMML